MSEQVAKIAVDLIDDPVVAMRTKVDDTALQDLAESIKSNGLIQPIILKKIGARFEVVAGHRRLRAHRLLKKTHVEAIVKAYTEEQAESAKVHENLFREDVNPVDQAVFLARYVERTKAELSDLARMLNRTPEWVESRLEILKYPDYLVTEVYNGTIGLGVAKLLNTIPNDRVKKDYTKFAALQGINIVTARRWSQLADTGHLPEQPTELVAQTDAQGQTRQVAMVKCLICQNLGEIGNLITDFVHPDCRAEYAAELAAAMSKLTPDENNDNPATSANHPVATAAPSTAPQEVKQG